MSRQKPLEQEVVGYDFADTVPLPGDIGVRDGNTIDQLVTNVKGINHYVDYIAFGEKSFMNDRDVNKPGLRKFVSGGIACPNGAEMSVYQDSTTKGNLLGERVKRGLQSAGLPAPAGVAPGILEDARDALNPIPLFTAAMASGFPDCELIAKDVGDLNGRTQPEIQDPENPTTWIEGPLEVGWPPKQRKWVQKLDRKKNPIWLTEEEFNKRPKTHNFDGSIRLPPAVKEIFTDYHRMNATPSNDMIPKLAAVGVLIALFGIFACLD
jgi:hypothetical protein